MVKNKIVELRLAVDRAINSMGLLIPFASNELNEAKNNFTGAKMWLGKVLGELGEEHPYKESLDPSNNHIAEQTDHTTEVCFTKEQYDLGHISRIKTLRLYVKEWTAQFKSCVSSDKPFTELAQASHYCLGYYQEALMRFEEAGMWLGCELHEISEREKLEKNQKAAPSLIVPANG